MALTLKEAITATQTTFDVIGLDTLTNGDMYSIDDEYVLINTATVQSIQPGETAYQRVSLDRGVLGTAKAAHAAAAALTAVNIASGGLTNPLLEPLAIEPTATDTNALLVTIPTGASVPGVKIAMDIDHGFQALVLTAGGGNIVEFYRTAIYFAPIGGPEAAFLVEPDGLPDITVPLADFSGSVTNTRVLRTGHLSLVTSALPADAEFRNFDLAFAYDNTDGAAKLLIKAKTANGTVVTGNVPLT